MDFIEKSEYTPTTTEYPDLFVNSVKMQDKDWIKNTNDFFAAQARIQYGKNLRTFARNYMLMKGELTPEDFYEAPEEVDNFMKELKVDALPKHIQHYSIVNQPINMLIGEMSSKPDNAFVKAFDADSQSEEFQYLTDLVSQYGTSLIQQKILNNLAQQGVDIQSEDAQQQIQQMTQKEFEEKYTSYTSLAERWANRMLENLKMQFNTKELGEDAFSDLLKAGREYLHIYEDNSHIGFNAACVNPKNVWKLSLPERKYAKDAYAIGIIEVMEISDILNTFELSKKEIDKLRDVKNRGSNATKATGMDSIKYSPIEDPFLHSIQDTPYQELYDEINSYMGIQTEGGSYYGEKFIVCTSYVLGKILVGTLQYIDQDGIPQTTFVSDDYKKGSHPGEVSLEWGYVNQWFKGVKIGEELYSWEPIKFVDSCPIVGGEYDPKNSPVKSFLDLMRPFQILYNIVLNQLFELLHKEIGVVYNINLRKIPVPKDGEYQDALDDWEALAREKGISFEDDSPENMRTPGNNTNLSKAIDLSRTGEIQNRYTLAQQLKQECWQLVGVTPERLGGVAASQTAQGTQVAMSQSYSQTEPWFTYHSYVMNHFYQLMLDAAQYYESQKPESTIAYISGEGEHVFIKVNQSDLRFKDLRVFVTDRAEDLASLQSMRQLAQSMLQNGVSAYEVSKVLSTKSIRGIEDSLKKVKDLQDEYQQRQQDIQQQQVQVQQQQIEQQAKQAEIARQDENMNKELDRKSKEKIAVITTYGYSKDNTQDADNNGQPDVLDLLKDNREQTKIQNDYENKVASQQIQQQTTNAKIQHDNKKLALEEERHRDDIKQKEADRKLKEKQLDTQKYIAKVNKN